MDDPPQTPPSTATEILAAIQALYPRAHEPAVAAQIQALSARYKTLDPTSVIVSAPEDPRTRSARHQRVCAAVAAGWTIANACRAEGMGVSTFYQAQRARPAGVDS